MREYQRNTNECKFNNLTTETIQAFRKYFEKYELENIESEIILCCETTSTKINQGFFSKLFGGANFAQKTAMFFTSTQLFWATVDQNNQITVLAAKLKEIEIKDFNSTLIEDNGLDIFGFLNESPKRVQSFIGFGEQQVANKFKEVLKETAISAKR